MLNVFKKLDFLGQEFNFELDESKIYKTVQGACFSFICILTAFIIALMFGKEVFERKNPIVSMSTVPLEDTKIYLKDIAITVSFSTVRGGNINDINRYLDISFSSTEINGFDKVKIKKLDTIDCSQAVFNDKLYPMIQEHLKLINRKAFCYSNDSDAYIVGRFPNFSSKAYKILVDMCDPSDKSRAIPCEVNSKFLELEPFVALGIGKANIDNSSPNPISFYIDAIPIPISPTLYKKHFINFRKDYYHNDIGWMLEDVRITEYVNYDFTYDMINVNSQSSNTRHVADFSISSGNNSFSTFRYYMKLQELFARVGGVANAVFIVMKVITYNYFRFIYLMFIKKNTFEFLEKRIEKINNLSKVKMENSIFRRANYEEVGINNGNISIKNNISIDSKLIKDNFSLKINEYSNNNNIENKNDRRNRITLKDNILNYKKEPQFSDIEDKFKIQIDKISDNKDNSNNESYYNNNESNVISLNKPKLIMLNRVNSNKLMNYSKKYKKNDNKEKKEGGKKQKYTEINVISLSNKADHISSISNSKNQDAGINNDNNDKNISKIQELSINTKANYFKDSNIYRNDESHLSNNSSYYVSINYFTYLKSIFCYCLYKDIYKNYKNDMMKVKHFLDIRRFNFFLIRQYSIKD